MHKWPRMWNGDLPYVGCPQMLFGRRGRTFVWIIPGTVFVDLTVVPERALEYVTTNPRLLASPLASWTDLGENAALWIPAGSVFFIFAMECGSSNTSEVVLQPWFSLEIMECPFKTPVGILPLVHGLCLNWERAPKSESWLTVPSEVLQWLSTVRETRPKVSFPPLCDGLAPPVSPPSVPALPDGSPASTTPGARNKRTGSPKSSGSMDPCGLADAPGPANPSRVWPTDLATPSRVSLASDVNASGAEGDQDATQTGQP